MGSGSSQFCVLGVTSGEQLFYAKDVNPMFRVSGNPEPIYYPQSTQWMSGCEPIIHPKNDVRICLKDIIDSNIKHVWVKCLGKPQPQETGDIGWANRPTQYTTLEVDEDGIVIIPKTMVFAKTTIKSRINDDDMEEVRKLVEISKTTGWSLGF